jgi:hypothetical protein
MRVLFFALTTVAAIPLAAQKSDPLAFLRSAQDSNDLAMARFRDRAYVPVRAGEVRSAGFLTEMHDLPLGHILGPVDPEIVHSTVSPQAILPGAVIGIQPPAGAGYHRGDTLTLAMVVPGPDGWGSIVIPTGLARVGDQTPRQTLATVIAMYEPIRGGQVTLPMEPLATPVTTAPVKVEGPVGKIIVSEKPRELNQPGGQLFADLGRGAGVHIGDFVEIRRKAAPRLNNADTIDDLVAVAQVVHVGDKSATLRLVRVADPDIRPGMPVLRVSTLPN